MSDGEIVLYNAEDSPTRVQLRAADGTVWLTDGLKSTPKDRDWLP
jgi:hypothetical protein